MNGSKFVPTCHHCGVIGHIRPQCSKLKREQNNVDRSLPKKSNRPKCIVCYHCDAFGHLRPQYSKFHAFKRIKRKEKLEFYGSCAKKGKPNLSENNILLKKVFNALNSLTMCISGYHSSDPRLTSHEILIPNNRSVWMRKGSYGWAFTLFGPWFNSFDLCRTLHALDTSLSCICASCISLYALFWLFLHLILFFCFVWVKIQNHIKNEKLKKFDHTCLSTYHMWVLPCTFVQMALCIYKLSLFFMHLFLCGKNLDIYVWLL